MRKDIEHSETDKQVRRLTRKEKIETFRKARKRRNRIIRDILMVVPVVVGVGLGIILYQGVREKEKSRESIVFAFQDRVADALPIVAVEKGFFKAEGLDITARVFCSGPECTEALISGGATFGTMGDTTAVILLSRRADAFKIICSHGGGEKRHRIVVSDKSEIRSITGLEAKKIGVKKGTSTHGGLLRFARKHGLDLRDSIVDMSPSLQLTALATGELDAIVASEPTPSQAEEGGFGRPLATLEGLGNSYPVLLAVKACFAQKHPDVVAKVLRALNRAEDFVEGHWDEAAVIQSEINGLGPEVIKRAMGFHSYSVSLDSKIRKSLMASAQFLKTNGTIDQMPDFDVALAPSYLMQASEGARRGE
ncbi:MAG: NrtA/SsuA/CpmA family ABC transporter substrate-binding protein [Desulfatiglans sp.]|jgi:ABC-type nitrate/sulfonate/bicarbonate transport system substrate-binding protein|nr:NrtA/SsuA/CpmA family ABC transporter substrate-binding protein [Thermodesulfobacteriota bacterium]MEE4354810.1 NrtA/SsuA/CpmA family ABC transporter substrate-binding protein [Desulfatiglans sp.]